VLTGAVGLRAVDKSVLLGFVEGFYSLWQNVVILLVIALVLIAISLRLLYAALVPPRRATRAVVRKTDEGSLSITVPTLQDIAIRTAKTVEGVKETCCEVLPLEGGVKVCFRVEPVNDVVLPQMGSQLQSLVKEQMETLTGINVLEVNVMVANAQPVNK
jgi:uncharacterized alkaline shock family protein YloU